MGHPVTSFFLSDFDDLSFKDDCTSRCHHHPHLTRGHSPVGGTGTGTGTGTRSHSRGTGTLSSHHSHSHSNHAPPPPPHQHHRSTHLHNHHPNHVPDGIPGRFVGPPNGPLPAEPMDPDLGEAFFFLADDHSWQRYYKQGWEERSLFFFRKNPNQIQTQNK